jgi:hypothetical protein
MGSVESPNFEKGVVSDMFNAEKDEDNLAVTLSKINAHDVQPHCHYDRRYAEDHQDCPSPSANIVEGGAHDVILKE